MQQFRGIKDSGDLEYTAEVHRCVRPTWVTYRVCLHGPTQTRIICDFDVHVGRYGGRDELLVDLAAIGEACHMAAKIATQFPWEIRWRMGYDSDPIDLDWWF